MRPSEPITIYLAIGASFGVSRYLSAVSVSRGRTRAIAEGLGAALLWPLAAAAILINGLRHRHGAEAEREREAKARGRVEEARRAFLISIDKMLEAVRALPQVAGGPAEQTLFALRDSAEQYAWLGLLDARADEDDEPEAYEAELARVSGRRGEDLRVAARCVHRRNVSRVKAHYQRERSRLLGKLAELRAEVSGEETIESAEARLELYLRAADLFSLLEDERAVRSAAKLVDAECLTLRRLREAEDAAAAAASSRAHGEERCAEHPQLILKDQLRATTFTQG
ncbi:MAG TPA: hypothetical protein VJS44_05735 [Pyrinomonadaceae bacterium]|nr:hypothetical protein [Pyrinomonadaceae bacterium]